MKQLMNVTPDKDIRKGARSLRSAMSYILCFMTPLRQIPFLSILNTPPLTRFFSTNPIISFCFGRKIVLSTSLALFLFQASNKGRSKFYFALLDYVLQCNVIRVLEIEIRMGAGHWGQRRKPLRGYGQGNMPAQPAFRYFNCTFFLLYRIRHIHICLRMSVVVFEGRIFVKNRSCFYALNSLREYKVQRSC
jgi:hypothetical protein